MSTIYYQLQINIIDFIPSYRRFEFWKLLNTFLFDLFFIERKYKKFGLIIFDFIPPNVSRKFSSGKKSTSFRILFAINFTGMENI